MSSFTPPRVAVCLLCACLVAFLIPEKCEGINMDYDTPEPVYRQKGLECLGFPGRPINFRAYDPAQKLSSVASCSGVLLNRNWVITAGHGVQPWQATGVFLVGMGTNARYDTEHRVRVKRAVVHPWDNGDLWSATRIDLALLELETPIDGFPDAVLATQTPADDALFTTAGLGTAGRAGAAARQPA
jgi:hypothetical protein